MNIVLNDYGSIPGVGTFGELKVAGETFYTAEKPWDDNKRFVSCIPGGVYRLEPFASQKYGDVWVMVSESLKVARADKPGYRYGCLIHNANWPKQVKGCIAIGLKNDYILGRLGVTSSKTALKRFLYLLEGRDEHILTIRRR